MLPSGGMSGSAGFSLLLVAILAAGLVPTLRRTGARNPVDDTLPAGTVIDFLRFPG